MWISQQMKEKLPVKVRVEMRNKTIRDLYRKKYSMDEICRYVNVSKTTVFFAIRGRGKKKVDGKNNN